MKTNNEKVGFFLIGFVAGLAVMLFGLLGMLDLKEPLKIEKEMNIIKQEACDRGYATYKPITEEWKWKENVIAVEQQALYNWMKNNYNKELNIGE